MVAMVAWYHIMYNYIYIYNIYTYASDALIRNVTDISINQ